MGLTEHWMGTFFKDIPGRKFTEICMPGSHDAAMSTESMGLFHWNKMPLMRAAKTQKEDLYGQMKFGSRWFDIRLEGMAREITYGSPNYYRVNKKVLGGRGRHQANSVICGYGENWQTMLENAFRFLTEQPSEFICFRLSKSDNSVWEFMKETTAKLRNDGKMLLDYENSVAQAEYGELRGKLLIFIDEDSGWDEGAQAADLTPRYGFYRFQGITKSKDHTRHTHPSILKSCGSYSGETNIKKVLGSEVMNSTPLAHLATIIRQTAGDSKFKAKVKQGWVSKDSVGQAGYMTGHVTKNCGGKDHDHLMFLYWTATSRMAAHIKKMTNQLNENYNRSGGGASAGATQATKDQLLGWGFDGDEPIKNGIREFIEAFKGSSNGSDLQLTGETSRLLNMMVDREGGNLQDFVPNVVMYDFVNENQSLEIIGLNHGIDISSLELFED
jgi:hypothetical protein